MHAAALLALLKNVPEDATVLIDTGDYEVQVGTIVYDDVHGIISLIPIDAEEDDAETGDEGYDEEEPEYRDPRYFANGSQCTLPEAKNHGVKDL